MKDKDKESEISDVIKQETRRGKRPIDIEERRRLAAVKQDIRKWLRLGTEDQFREAMRVLGFRDSSEVMEYLVQAWRDFREP